MLLSHLRIIAASTRFTTVHNQLPLRSPKIQNHTLFMLCLYLFPWCGRECISLSFDYQCGQYTQRKQWCTSIDILWLRVGYLNATINRTTQTPAPKIGPHRSTGNKTYPSVDGCGSLFGSARHPANNLPNADGMGDWYWAVPNVTVWTYWCPRQHFWDSWILTRIGTGSDSSELLLIQVS